MPEDNNNPTPNGQAPNGTDPTSQALTSTGQAPNESPNSNLSNEALQQQIAELRRENAAHRRKAKEQEDVAQKAEQQRLKEQGEFKQLAEQHETRVRELEPVAERYHALSMQMALQIESQIKDWPTEVLAFDPGNDAPVEERLAWIEKSRPLIDKLQMQARSQSPGNMPNPRPTASTPEDAQNHFLQQMRATGKYGA